MWNMTVFVDFFLKIIEFFFWKHTHSTALCTVSKKRNSIFPSLKTETGHTKSIYCAWGLLTLHQRQMSVERRIRQLDYNMPDPFVLRGNTVSRYREESGSSLLLSPPFRTHAKLTKLSVQVYVEGKGEIAISWTCIWPVAISSTLPT